MEDAVAQYGHASLRGPCMQSWLWHTYSCVPKLQLRQSNSSFSTPRTADISVCKTFYVYTHMHVGSGFWKPKFLKLLWFFCFVFFKWLCHIPKRSGGAHWRAAWERVLHIASSWPIPLPHLGQRGPAETVTVWMSRQLRFLPNPLLISRSDGDMRYPNEGPRLGSAKRPWHEGEFPQPCPLPPRVSRVRPLQRVRFQTALKIFIAQKCKGSNETLTLNAALPGRRAGAGLLRRAAGCLGGFLQLTIPCGPPPSPFLSCFHVKIH